MKDAQPDIGRCPRRAEPPSDINRHLSCLGVPLRFPNPGSDIPRMIHNYRLIFEASERDGVDMFDLDYMTGVLTDNFQASSRGAVGAAARERSAQEDRSRDPLYNQLKMYSEVYRMLGWLRPGERRLEFTTTILGAQIADDFADRPDLIYGLVRQCLLSVTFPNPATENIGVANHRPFSWLLRLAAELGGVITRHEMILGLLAVVDDLDPDALPNAVAGITRVRGGNRSVLDVAVERYAASANVQVNTLENYTRLPVGVLKSADVEWATSGRTSGLYSKPVEAVALTALGRGDAAWAASAIDIREAHLEGFDVDERAHFANYGHYAMLVRSGLELAMVQADLNRAAAGCPSILGHFGVDSPGVLLYSPMQQASDDILGRAEAVE